MKALNLILILGLFSLTACEGGGAGGGAASGGGGSSAQSLSSSGVTQAPCAGQNFVARWRYNNFAPGSTPAYDVMTINDQCVIQSSFCGQWYGSDVKIEVRGTEDPVTHEIPIRITQPNAAPSACIQPGTYDCDIFVLSINGNITLGLNCPNSNRPSLGYGLY